MELECQHETDLFRCDLLKVSNEVRGGRFIYPDPPRWTETWVSPIAGFTYETLGGRRSVGVSEAHLSLLPHESEESNATGYNVPQLLKGGGGIGSLGRRQESRRVCFAAAHPQFLTLVRVNHNCIQRVGERTYLSTKTSHRCAGRSTNLGVFVWCAFNSKQLDSSIIRGLFTQTLAVIWPCRLKKNSCCSCSVSVCPFLLCLQTQAIQERSVKDKLCTMTFFLSYIVFILRNDRCMLLLSLSAFILKKCCTLLVYTLQKKKKKKQNLFIYSFICHCSPYVAPQPFRHCHEFPTNFITAGSHLAFTYGINWGRSSFVALRGRNDPNQVKHM